MEAVPDTPTRLKQLQLAQKLERTFKSFKRITQTDLRVTSLVQIERSEKGQNQEERAFQEMLRIHFKKVINEIEEQTVTKMFRLVYSEVRNFEIFSNSTSLLGRLNPYKSLSSSFVIDAGKNKAYRMGRKSIKEAFKVKIFRRRDLIGRGWREEEFEEIKERVVDRIMTIASALTARLEHRSNLDEFENENINSEEIITPPHLGNLIIKKLVQNHKEINDWQGG